MDYKNRAKITPDIKQTKWDVISVGTGLTALTTAVALSKKGKKVLMLEHHLVPGGYASSFTRKQFKFEVSLHQTLALNEGGYMNGILTELGVIDKINPIPLGSTIKLETELGDFYVGPDYLMQLKRAFPEEAKSIAKFDKLIVRVQRHAMIAMMLSGLPKSLRYPLAAIFARSVYKHYRHTLTDMLNTYFKDSRLKQLIAVQWGYYGLPQDRISGLMYLLDWGGFLKRGIYYLKGSSQTLSNGFVERLEELGGSVVFRQNVEEVLIENGKAVGVRTRKIQKNGKGEVNEFRAPIILSGANPFYTFEHLLDGKKHIPQAYWDTLNSLEPSMSAVCAYIGLDTRFENFSHDSHHSSDKLNIGETDFNKLFKETRSSTYKGFGNVIHHTAMDPSLAPPGKSIIATIRGEYDDNWKDLSEEEYRAKKEVLTEEIISSLNERYPGLRDHIEVIEVATPNTMKRFTNNHTGAFNGFALSVDRVKMFDGGIPFETPVKGLYLANAWAGAVGGGFAGSVPVGFTLAQSISRSMK